MKRYRRGSKEPQLNDPDSELFEAKSHSSSSYHQTERKGRQLCQQVKRALNLALADRSISTGVADLYVEEVAPAPDCGRLLVQVVIPDIRAVADVIAALNHEKPRLRAEVAAAVTRKRAPDLCFAPAYADGGEHE